MKDLPHILQWKIASSESTGKYQKMNVLFKLPHQCTLLKKESKTDYRTKFWLRLFNSSLAMLFFFSYLFTVNNGFVWKENLFNLQVFFQVANFLQREFQ